MKTSLFLVTFGGDADWLPYLFRSIAKHVTGFDEIVAAYEVGHEAQVLPVIPVGVTLKPYPRSYHGYFKQQEVKCFADHHCQGDLITHVDSDCVFTEPVTPQTFQRTGKPILLFTHYSSLGHTVPWQIPTEKALGRKVDVETMRRHGCTYWRDTYGKARQRMEDCHGSPLPEYLACLQRGGPEFSEFNALGAYAYYWEPHRYALVDTETPACPPSPFRQFWSHHRPSHTEVQKEMKALGLA